MTENEKPDGSLDVIESLDILADLAHAAAKAITGPIEHPAVWRPLRAPLTLGKIALYASIWTLVIIPLLVFVWPVYLLHRWRA